MRSEFVSFEDLSTNQLSNVKMTCLILICYLFLHVACACESGKGVLTHVYNLHPHPRLIDSLTSSILASPPNCFAIRQPSPAPVSGQIPI